MPSHHVAVVVPADFTGTGCLVHRAVREVLDHPHGPSAAVLFGQFGQHVPGDGEFSQLALGLLKASPYQQVDGGGPERGVA